MLLLQSKFYKIVAHKRCCLDPNNNQMGGLIVHKMVALAPWKKEAGLAMRSQISEMGDPCLSPPGGMS